MMKIFKYGLFFINILLLHSYISASSFMTKVVDKDIQYSQLEGYSCTVYKAKNFNLDPEFAAMMQQDQAIQDFTSGSTSFVNLSDVYMVFAIRNAEQRLCAFIKCHAASKDLVVIDLIIVHSHFRRLGLAMYMIKLVEFFSQSLGIKELGLIVLNDNDAAIKCYEKYGFILNRD